MILSPAVTAKSVAGTLYAPVAMHFAIAGRSSEIGPSPLEKTRRQFVDNRERAPDLADRALPEPSAFVAQRISQERPAEDAAGLRSGAIAAYGAQARQSRFVAGPVSGIDLIV